MNAIELNNITKVYKIYKKPVYRLIDALLGTKHYSEHFALNNVSLSIEKGETVGVLGKNGAGKSTLLKILTGVTTPTEGTVKVNGKIAAILELNSGFDEELTGFDNILLKSTILGYSKEEALSKVDDIIEFADIGKYINQPVRTYSSGMKARLGFAIAVNTNPDILIVDEALSVGDEIFRTKCLKKMDDFRKAGKTIFFVSHSIFTIKSFCTKAAWIKDGQLVSYGEMGTVVQQYESFLKEEKAKKMKEKPEKSLERQDYIAAYNLKFANNKNSFNYGEDIVFSFDYNVKKDVGNLRWTLTIRDVDEKEIYSSDKLSDKYEIESSLGKHKLTIRLKDLKLLPGKYKLSGEIRNETGIIYIGYANKKEIIINDTDDFIGSGIWHIEHELVR